MAAYQYIAVSPSGKDLKGIIEADSDLKARQLLRAQGLIPTVVKPLKDRASKVHRSDKLSTADLSLLTRQLATLLEAGIPIVEALEGLAEQTEKNKPREIVIGIRSKVLEGYSLAQALGDFPNAFPELYRATVGAGEQTGRLDVVLEKLADYMEKQQETRQKIHQALIYPALMIIVSTGIIVFLMSFVVPNIIEVFRTGGQSLPKMTQVLISISQFTKSYSLYLLLGLTLSIMLFKRSLANKSIQFAWHRLILRLPISSYLSNSINVARYVHTFGILFAAGVSVLETMRVSASLVSNVVMRASFDKATIRVREGASISQALKDTGFLSPMALHLIASGEKSGQISSMMARTAQHLDNEVRRLIDTALTLLEPLVILLMGGVVLFIVLATLLPIFSMEQLVG